MNRADTYVRIFIFLLSLIVLGAMVIDYGFDLDARDLAVIKRVYGVAWWCYFLMFTLWIASDKGSANGSRRVMNWILGAFLYLSVLPKIFGVASIPAWLEHVWSILSGKHYNVLLLLVFALLEVSRGVVNFINKRTNPTLLLATGFAMVIFLGTLFLLLPRSTQEHIHLRVIDAFFVATSAVCVTGLSPVDIASTFTLEGEIVIMLMIQIGGLGVMTITSFFALFFMGMPSLYSQFALKDMVGSDTFGSLLSTLRYILGFTFAIEFVGAILIWLSIHSTMEMTLWQEIFFSIFHSISAFCNAGFSTLEGNLGNGAVAADHNLFFIVISFLVILGGIGYPILVNLKNLADYYVKGIYRRFFKREDHMKRFTHIANINTRIVLVSTIILVVGGTCAIAVLEWNGAFSDMSGPDKLVQSLFNAVVPRTAGFNSVDIASFSSVTIVVYIILMWIGGASQSTAGGIKVNTIAVSVANFVSIIRGRNAAVAFNREISPYSVRRASAAILGSIIVISLSFVLLLLVEPHIEPQKLFFETVSAYSTVGGSLNTTPLLGEAGKIIISMLMFIGRVGLITLLMGIAQPKEYPKYRYPQDRIIIN